MIRSLRPPIRPAVSTAHIVGLALVPALSGTERGLLVPGLKVSEILLVLLAASLILRSRGNWPAADALGALVVVYVATGFVVTIFHLMQSPLMSMAGGAAELSAFLQYGVLYFVGFAVGFGSGSPLRFIRSSLLVASLVSVIAILQMVDFPTVRSLLAVLTGNDRILNPLNWQVYRGTSIFPSWHALGAYSSMHVVIAASLLTNRAVQLRTRDGAFIAVCAALCFVGVLTTATATPILLASLGVLWFGISAARLGVIALSASGGLVAVALSPVGPAIVERIDRQFGGSNSGFLPQSLGYRVSVWERDFLPVIDDNFWFGYGPIDSLGGVFAYTESMYILLLVSGGAALLTVFLVFYFGAITRMSMMVRGSSGPLQALCRACLFILVVLLLGQVIHPYLRDAGGSIALFAIIGIAAGSFCRGSRSPTTGCEDMPRRSGGGYSESNQRA